MKKISVLILSVFCAISSVSCSVRTHEVIADKARSGYAILLPLEEPVICQVGEDWYMQGRKTLVYRSGRPVLYKEIDQEKKYHPERYYLDDDDHRNFDYEPVYAPMPKEMAENMMKGIYTHSDAISFINTKWRLDLPQGEVKQWKTRASTPAYFRNLSSHRMLQTENGTYLLARVGEMTADFSAIFMYPLAGLSAVLIDAPGSILVGPPTKMEQKAEAEEL